MAIPYHFIVSSFHLSTWPPGEVVAHPLFMMRRQYISRERPVWQVGSLRAMSRDLPPLLMTQGWKLGVISKPDICCQRHEIALVHQHQFLPLKARHVKKTTASICFNSWWVQFLSPLSTSWSVLCVLWSVSCVPDHSHVLDDGSSFSGRPKERASYVSCVYTYV